MDGICTYTSNVFLNAVCDESLYTIDHNYEGIQHNVTKHFLNKIKHHSI